jgi:hypothetical protein
MTNRVCCRPEADNASADAAAQEERICVIEHYITSLN